MRIIPIVKGLASYIPGLSDVYLKSRGTGIPVSAQYYYSAWLHHLATLGKSGLPTRFDVVAELGPGDSLGAGLAALLSGAQQYFSLDIVQFTNQERNITIFDELINLFQQRAPMGEVPNECEFPNQILTDQFLEKALAPQRLDAIRQALSSHHRNQEGIEIRYYCPWNDPEIIQKEAVDLIFSTAVMEHVNDLQMVYQSMSEWLKPGGVISHQIDFRCHQTGRVWNEHWTYSDFVWQLIRGKRDFLLNREPHSAHIRLMKKNGFKVICDITSKNDSGINRRCLAPRFKKLSDDDFSTCGALIQAIKVDK